jgi:CDP-diacylglycerol--glycerol-3-phosphate 3-phosphatidyltransferase
MLTFKNYNIADWFSFYRILAVPLLIALIWLGDRTLFTWFLLVSYSTDAIDGFLARKLKISSARGSQLDSIGDQITLVVGLIGLVVFENEFIKTNYILILIAFVPYILQMVIAFYKYGKSTAFHTYLAKSSAVLQGVFILFTLFFAPVYWLFYLMIVIGVLETIEEITLIYMYDKWVDNVKGIYWALKDERRQ